MDMSLAFDGATLALSATMSFELANELTAPTDARSFEDMLLDLGLPSEFAQLFLGGPEESLDWLLPGGI